MSRGLRILFVVVFLPVAGWAQADPAPPIIDDITPVSGSTRGGTLVTISGRNLASTIVCIVPCPTGIFFGAVEAEITAVGASSFTVAAPPHAPGDVDLSVVFGDTRKATAPGAFRYMATAEDAYERVLLPLYFDGKQAGGYGSAWQTDLWVRNDGQGYVAVAPLDCGSAICPAIFPGNRSLLPGEAMHGLGKGQSNVAGTGRLLYVTPGNSPRVSWQLRVFDGSASEVNAGTELRVVHERDFLRQTAQLHNVPNSTGYRLLLRLYEMNEFPASFRVRGFPEFEGNVATSAVFDVVLTTASSEVGLFRSAPGYAQMAIPATPLMYLGPTDPPLRLEIQPLTPGSAFWAFVSITNNTTQQVTTVSP